MLTRVSRAKSIDFKAVCSALRDFTFPPCDCIVGIGQGGIVPASLIAYHLRCELKIIRISYRSDDNTPQYPEPRVLAATALRGKKKILIVDDVSVSGKTLQSAKGLFPRHHVQTMVLRGFADYVLFPRLVSCVRWPWKI